MSKYPWVALGVALAALFTVYFASVWSPPQSFEVNVTLYFKVKGPGVERTQPFGWALIGDHGQWGYVWVRLSLPEVVDLYYVSEGGKNYTAVYVGGRFQRVEAAAQPAIELIKLGEAKTGELGACHHLGRTGKLFKIEVPLDWSLINEIARQPVVVNSSVEGYFCEEGRVPLWMLVKFTATLRDGQTIVVEYHMNTTRIAHFNQSRYQEVLKRAKG